MTDDLKELRQQFDDDWDAWSEPRQERATDMKYLSGDPWKKTDRDKREAAGRFCLTFDELSQYINQIVNEVRANPRSAQFAPAGEGTSEAAAQFYADKWREIEYRSNSHLATTAAFEAAVMGGMGAARLVSDYQPGSVDRQELTIKPVFDANTILPDPSFQRPDGSDMTRCNVLEKRPIRDFQQMFPKAKVKDFGDFLRDDSYSKWIGEKDILLCESWTVRQTPVKLLLVQPPSVTPPGGMMGLRGPQAPPPITIEEAQWATMREGSKVIRERIEHRPTVYKQLVNGVEVLEETSWPGPYIPIALCLGRVLYLDEGGGESKRVILSATRLARDPFMAYCFYRTCEMENVGMTTKNPYWAYEGQLDEIQQTEIAKSLHEPVAVLFAKATIDGLPATQPVPLPQRNISEPAIQALSVGAEECRRAIQSAFATNFLPTAAQKLNEKSGRALEKIDQARQKGSFHFVDHYGLMLRHLADLGQWAMDAFYDTEREVAVRRPNEEMETIWINSQKPDAIPSIKGHYQVTISEGPSVDSTREAASDFADMLLGNQILLQLLGPQKAQQLAALAIQLKVKQTGIGAIGDEIVEIVGPPKEGEAPNPQALQQALQQADQLLQQAMGRIKELESEQGQKMAIEELKGEIQKALKVIDGQQKERQIALKGQQDLAKEAARGDVDLTLQNDEQAHEASMGSAEAAHAEATADKAMLAAMAKPEGGSNGNGKPNGAAKA